jgi:hypothetical protein
MFDFIQAFLNMASVSEVGYSKVLWTYISGHWSHTKEMAKFYQISISIWPILDKMINIAELEISLNVAKTTLESINTTQVKPIHIPVSQAIAEIHKIDYRITELENKTKAVSKLCNDVQNIIKTLKVLGSAGPGIVQVLGKVMGAIEKLQLFRRIDGVVKNVLGVIEKVSEQILARLWLTETQFKTKIWERITKVVRKVNDALESVQKKLETWPKTLELVVFYIRAANSLDAENLTKLIGDSTG